MSDEIDTLRGRLGAYTSWGRTTDRSARTAPARAAFAQRFLDQADGDPVRAEALRKAYYTKLSLKAAAARRRAKALTEVADAAEAEITAGLS